MSAELASQIHLHKYSSQTPQNIMLGVTKQNVCEEIPTRNEGCDSKELVQDKVRENKFLFPHNK